MTRCTRCNRPLTKPAIHGMGPRCAQVTLGAKPRRQRVVPKGDERQAEMFAEVRNA